jgi:hypothetical protein
MGSTKLDPELLGVLSFLQKHRSVRQRIAAPVNKTVVYSGGLPVSNGDDLHAAWKLLEQAKAKDPSRFDYVTLEERLRQFHAVEWGETLFDHANRVAKSLKDRKLDSQAVILWRALSGIYVQGARGRVRALVVPGPAIAGSVFSLTEVSVLLRPDVLRQIEIDPTALRDFRTTVRVGNRPAPIVVM